MSKPLLTDEMIEQAKREKWDELANEHLDDELFSQTEFQEERIYKSRRIENKKRSLFRSKLNRILLVIILLLMLLLWAVFKL